eukprot:m.72941 g.72941  ORF g.72941 m.72941 type:complete len:106 (+) comp11763_c0_seq2:89-406(+)
MSEQIVQSAIANNKVVIFSKTYCPFCTQAKSAINGIVSDALVIELDEGKVNYDGNSADGSAVQGVIKSKYSHRTVPAVFINGKLLGGCDDTLAAIKNGTFKKMVA